MEQVVAPAHCRLQVFEVADVVADERQPFIAGPVPEI